MSNVHPIHESKPEKRRLRPRGLYVTDEQIIEALGLSPKDGAVAIAAMDKDPRKSGFPQKQPLFANRRYWPAVKAYFDRLNGLKVDASVTRLRNRHDD